MSSSSYSSPLNANLPFSAKKKHPHPLPDCPPTEKASCISPYNVDEIEGKKYIEAVTSNMVYQNSFYPFCTSNSIRTIDDTRIEDEVLFLWLGLDLFSANAQGFGQLNWKTDKSACYDHIQMLEVFLYLGQFASTQNEDVDITQTAMAARANNIQMESTIKVISGYLFRTSKRVIPGKQSFDDIWYRRLMSNAAREERLMNLSFGIVQDDRDDEADDGVNDNVGAYGQNGYHKKNRKSQRIPKSEELSSYCSLTFTKWNELCVRLQGLNTDVINSSLNSTKYHGMISPVKYFNLRFALRFMGACNITIDPAYLTLSRYVLFDPRIPIRENDPDDELNRSLVYIFPNNGDLVYKLEKNAFTVNNYHTREFFHIRHQESQSELYKNPTYLRFKQRLSLQYTNDEFKKNFLTDEIDIIQLYYNSATFVQKVPIYDEDSFIQNMMIRVRKLTTHPELIDPAETYKKMENSIRQSTIDIQINGLGEYVSHLTQSTSNISPALRAMNEWGSKLIQSKELYNLCSIRPHRHMNLSPLADLLVGIMAVLEGLFALYIAHDRVLLFLIAVYSLYTNPRLPCHILSLGAPKTSKSFTQIILQYLLIPGSWEAMSRFTPQALTGELEDENDPNRDKQSQYMVYMFEEIQSTCLGVDPKDSIHQTRTVGNGGNGIRRTNPGGNSETEQQWKLVLDSNQLTTRQLTIKDGRRVQQLFKVLVKPLIIAAGNNTPDEVSLPVKSRMFIIKVVEEIRPDSALMTKAQQTFNPEQLHMKAEFIMMTQLLQYHCQRAGGLIRTKVLNPTENVSAFDWKVANAIISLVAFHGPSYGLTGLSDIRNIIRVRDLCEGLTLLNAVNLLYNSELTPLRGHPFHHIHASLLAKYLFINSEIVSIAFGLLEGQFYNKTVPLAMKCLFALDHKLKQTETETENQTTQIITGNDRFYNPIVISPELEEKYSNQSNPAPKTKKRKHQRDKQQTSIDLQPFLNAVVATEVNPINAPNTTIPLSDLNVSAAEEKEMVDLDPYYNDIHNWDTRKLLTKENLNKPSDTYAVAVTLLTSLPNMNPKPSLEDLDSALQTLLDTQISVLDLEDTHRTSRLNKNVLIIQPTRLRILKEASVLNKQNKQYGVKACLEHILNHRYAKRRDVLYGGCIANRGLPYALDVISVVPNPNAKHLKTPNHKYLNEQLKTSIQQFTQQLNLNSIDLEISFDWSNAWKNYEESLETRHEFVIWNSDFDEAGTELFNMNTRFSDKEIKMQPNNDIYIHQQDLMNYSSQNPVDAIPYPLCHPMYHLDSYRKSYQEKHTRNEFPNIQDQIKRKKENSSRIYNDIETEWKKQYEKDPIQKRILDQIKKEMMKEKGFRDYASKHPINTRTLYNLANDSIPEIPNEPNPLLRDITTNLPQKQFLLTSDFESRADGTFTLIPRSDLAKLYELKQQNRKIRKLRKEQEELQKHLQQQQLQQQQQQQPEPISQSDAEDQESMKVETEEEENHDYEEEMGDDDEDEDDDYEHIDNAGDASSVESYIQQQHTTMQSNLKKTSDLLHEKHKAKPINESILFNPMRLVYHEGSDISI